MDIVERLRDMQGKKYRPDWSEWVQKQCAEAADEIEHLNRLLDEQGKTSCSLFDTARQNQLDAERYRWLRDAMTGDNAHRVHDETCSNLLAGPALDAAIDAAMA